MLHTIRKRRPLCQCDGEVGEVSSRAENRERDVALDSLAERAEYRQAASALPIFDSNGTLVCAPVDNLERRDLEP